MRRSVLLLLVLSSTSFAGNGTNFLGVTPDGQATAGTGVAAFLSPTQATFQNPALLSLMKNKSSATLSLTKANADYQASIKNDLSSPPTPETGFKKSQYAIPLVPAVGGTYQVDDKINLGFGVFGYSGLGTDFKEEMALLKQEFKSSQLKYMLNY